MNPTQNASAPATRLLLVDTLTPERVETATFSLG